MKKITLLLSAKKQERALRKLRKLGVLHIHPLENRESMDVESLRARRADLEKAVSVLADVPTSGAARGVDVDPGKTADRVLGLQDALKKTSGRIQELRELYSWFEKFGKISARTLSRLREAGVYVTFYTAEAAALKNIRAEGDIQVASREGGIACLAYFSRTPDDRLDLTMHTMPDAEVDELEKELERAVKEKAGLEEKLRSLAPRRETILNGIERLDSRIELAEVRDGMMMEENVVLLQGFCPTESVDGLKKAADRNQWAYVITDPDDPREVPTLLRNPRWLRMIQPLFDFMGTLPGYYEIDVSFVFLAFFSLFFAMLIGDAGYGLVFLGATALFRKKLPDAPKEPFSLFYLLSGTTVVWGIITGTWFGSEALANLPVLNALVIPAFDSFSETSSEAVMEFSFIVGLAHLAVARLMSAVKIINSPRAIAQVGWVGILAGIYFVANNLVLGKAMPGFTGPLLLASVLVVALFANFQKNIVKGFFLSLGNLPLDIISSFSDIVSYIRLFAVGFASVIVASSFNDMASAVGMNSVFSSAVTAVILVFGHGLNIMLGMMSVLVHGVRLNMLEFSGHVNMEWSGKPYSPFRET